MRNHANEVKSLLAELRRIGIDLSSPKSVYIFAVTKSRTDALHLRRRIMTSLRKGKHSFAWIEKAGNRQFEVTSAVRSLPTHAKLLRLKSQFYRLASSKKGTYKGLSIALGLDRYCPLISPALAQSLTQREIERQTGDS